LTGEDLSKEEHVDNELLWNLKLLSEVSLSAIKLTYLIYLKRLLRDMICSRR